NEKILDGNIAAAGRVEQVRVVAEVGVRAVRIERAAIEGGELQFGRTEGSHDAVFSGGGSIDLQQEEGAGGEKIVIEGWRPGIAVPGGRAVGAGRIEGDVGADVAADLDAGVGAGNVEEAGAIERADFDILYRFGLDRKVGCLRATRDQQARGRTEDNGLN